MVRKERKTISRELYDIVIEMSQSESFKIKDIVRNTQFERQVVRNIIKRHESGIPFISAVNKIKRTYEQKK